MFPDSAHFQLTGRCNLNCRFCGQAKGMLATKSHEFAPDFWVKLAQEFLDNNIAHPAITLWGGEPLLYDEIESLGRQLYEMGCKLEIVTNGTLIERHVDFLNKYIDIIHISVDGPQELHNASRGMGVFEKISRQIPLLSSRRGKLSFLTTISDCNVDIMAELPHMLSPLAPDMITLQPLMYLSSEEIANYQAFSLEHFGYDYPNLSAWQRDDAVAYREKLAIGIAKFKEQTYPMQVSFTAHSPDGEPCRKPWERVHVRCDGAVGFCSDYFGFSLGKLTEKSLYELFNSEVATTYRNAVTENKLTTCRHCPWRLQHKSIDTDSHC